MTYTIYIILTNSFQNACDEFVTEYYEWFYNPRGWLVCGSSWKLLWKGSRVAPLMSTVEFIELKIGRVPSHQISQRTTLNTLNLSNHRGRFPVPSIMFVQPNYDAGQFTIITITKLRKKFSTKSRTGTDRPTGACKGNSMYVWSPDPDITSGSMIIGDTQRQ